MDVKISSDGPCPLVIFRHGVQFLPCTCLYVIVEDEYVNKVVLAFLVSKICLIGYPTSRPSWDFQNRKWCQNSSAKQNQRGNSCGNNRADFNSYPCSSLDFAYKTMRSKNIQLYSFYYCTLPLTLPEIPSTRILETVARTNTFPPGFSITGMIWKAISLAPPRG